MTTSDITIRHVVVISTHLHVKLHKEGNLTTDTHSFSFDVFSIDGILRERFEWRHSKRPEIKLCAAGNLGKEKYIGDERGLKLVKFRTKELVAVFSSGKHNKVNNPIKIEGKLRFITFKQEREEFQKAVCVIDT